MSSQPVPADQADSCAARLPGDSGLWVFIIADMMAFAVFFIVFSAGRVQEPALFEASRRHLDARLGLANTLILLTSSLFMVRAVEAARRHDAGAARRGLAWTMAIGSLFAVSKAFEYGMKFRAGITMLTNSFFTYYFVFTGVHLLHFTVGLAALAVCYAKLGREEMAGETGGRLAIWTEATGCYWHLVDLLWIMLFPMLYLLRAA